MHLHQKLHSRQKWCHCMGLAVSCSTMNVVNVSSVICRLLTVQSWLHFLLAIAPGWWPLGSPWWCQSSAYHDPGEWPAHWVQCYGWRTRQCAAKLCLAQSLVPTHRKAGAIDCHACTYLYCICFARGELDLYRGEIILLRDMMYMPFALHNTCSSVVLRVCGSVLQTWQVLYLWTRKMFWAASFAAQDLCILLVKGREWQAETTCSQDTGNLNAELIRWQDES